MESIEQQVKKELINMDQRLYELEEKMISIDQKLTQVVEAILGNPLTKTGGFVKELDTLKVEIQELKDKVNKQEEFKQRIIWTIGIIVSIALALQYLTSLYIKLQQ